MSESPQSPGGHDPAQARSAAQKSAQTGEYRKSLLANPHDRDVPPSPLPRPAQWALVGVFLILVAIGVFFFALDRWRRGTTAMGAGLVFLATIRWMVDSEVLGIFAVRSRKFDSLFAGTIGLIMMYLAISVDTLGS